jgi:hypothetical protein
MQRLTGGAAISSQDELIRAQMLVACHRAISVVDTWRGASGRRLAKHDVADEAGSTVYRASTRNASTPCRKRRRHSIAGSVETPNAPPEFVASDQYRIDRLVWPKKPTPKKGAIEFGDPGICGSSRAADPRRGCHCPNHHPGCGCLWHGGLGAYRSGFRRLSWLCAGWYYLPADGLRFSELCANGHR